MNDGWSARAKRCRSPGMAIHEAVAFSDLRRLKSTRMVDEVDSRLGSCMRLNRTTAGLDASRIISRVLWTGRC